MAVAWRRARTPSLDSQKWKVLAVNGQRYLIKALFDDQGYHVMISDLSTIWEEDPGAEKILRRGRVSVLSIIRRCVQPNVVCMQRNRLTQRMMGYPIGSCM